MDCCSNALGDLILSQDPDPNDTADQVSEEQSILCEDDARHHRVEREGDKDWYRSCTDDSAVPARVSAGLGLTREAYPFKSCIPVSAAFSIVSLNNIMMCWYTPRCSTCEHMHIKAFAS